jgi:dTDP-4-dehydrorhamnose 3,5-epimerase-like enzyme
MSLIHHTQLTAREDGRGALVAIEGLVDVPFVIRRIYYIFGTKNDVRRGCHAHYRLTQMAICVSGSCRFVMDDGSERVEQLLDSKTTGLLIEPMVWHEMYDFSPDCVLLVLADGPYDRADYITDYGQFRHLALGSLDETRLAVA